MRRVSWLRALKASGPSTTTDTAEPDRFDAALVRLCVVMVIGAAAPLLDTTIVSVALDTLGRQFDADVSTIQWVMSGYLLAMAMVIPATGWAVERFGARRVWIWSVIAFGIGSVLAGAAWSAGSLIAFRILQGVGGGAILPVGATLLTQAAGPRRLGRVTAVVSVPAQIAPIAGLLVGGLIVEELSWRWCFFLNVPVCLVAAGFAHRMVPAVPGEPAQRLDVRGLAMLAPALGALTYGLSRAGTAGFTDRAVVATLATGTVLGAAFVVHALRTRTPPLIDVRLFARRSFAGATTMLFLLSGSLFGSVVIVPLYVQQVGGAGALVAGLALAPQFAGTLVALAFVGRLADRLPPRDVVLGGVLVAVLGTLPFTQVSHGPDVVLLCAALFVRGIGFGAASVTLMTAAYRDVAPSHVPRATSALQIGQRIGAPLGAAVLAVVLQHHLAGAVGAPALAIAYESTFWCSLAFTAPALLPAVLLRGTRAARMPGATSPGR
jgi:EmrB/QacA subfamily drug resistance transporter